MKQKIVNELKMTFPSLSENERFSRLAVSGFLSQLNPQIDELSDIKTAVSEAVTNCIVHAYRNVTGLIFIQVRIMENSKVYIKIRDKGCGIPDIKKAMEPLFTTAPEEERAGLGFAVISEDVVACMEPAFKVNLLSQWTYHHRLFSAARYITGQVLRVDGGQTVTGNIESMKEDF